MTEVNRVHGVACGVLAIDIKTLAEKLGTSITTDFLEGGLHSTPGELRRRLQASIDRASTAGACDKIAVGYGICGRGSVGIHARNIPLAIPKAHDCIALFLGSDSAYRREFSRFPGTYYISPGGFEEKVQPKSDPREKAEFNIRLQEKYGQNANSFQEMAALLDFWRESYVPKSEVDRLAQEKAAAIRESDLAEASKNVQTPVELPPTGGTVANYTEACRLFNSGEIPTARFKELKRQFGVD